MVQSNNQSGAPPPAHKRTGSHHHVRRRSGPAAAGALADYRRASDNATRSGKRLPSQGRRVAPVSALMLNQNQSQSQRRQEKDSLDDEDSPLAEPHERESFPQYW